jgi:PleD family two-component response regulator
MVPIYEKSNTLLIEQADIALYQAKHDGRNRICSFTA